MKQGIVYDIGWLLAIGGAIVQLLQLQNPEN
jgi:hypothetical protein